jgi:hypothetical protein
MRRWKDRASDRFRRGDLLTYFPVVLDVRHLQAALDTSLPPPAFPT